MSNKDLNNTCNEACKYAQRALTGLRGALTWVKPSPSNVDDRDPNMMLESLLEAAENNLETALAEVRKARAAIKSTPVVAA